MSQTAASPDRWERISQIFNSALSLPVGEREAFLLRECGSDEDLLRLVRSMLNVDPTDANLSPVSVRQAPLPPGHMVAERFRILRFIASGGMGEVYEAEDLELRDRVALKTIRGDVVGGANAFESFRREIQLAKRIAHPNVCRVHDLVRDRAAEESLYLSMELLVGETLAQRIRRVGALDRSAALDIARQVAAGLDAIHAAKIVHRDLKSSNVILVEDSAAAQGWRAVVTDFGLARRAVGADATELTQMGVAGTPAYMAPEQVQGGTVDSPTDVYAFGVVLFEMVCGRLPFIADTPLATAVKRLQEQPPSPRQFAPDLPVAWERAILRCLERAPSDRFGSASEAIAALTGPRSLRVPHWWPRVALTCLLLALSGAVAWQVLQLATPAGRDTVTVGSRRSVALLGFRNLSESQDDAWLSTALVEGLSSELGATGQLRVLPGQEVTRAREELGVDAAETLAQDTLQRVRANLGTDLVIVGAYTVTRGSEGDLIRVDLRVQDTTTGETFAWLSRDGTKGALSKLISETGAELGRRLGVPLASTGSRGALPTGSETLRRYSEGLDDLRRFNAGAAKEKLAWVIQLEPRFARGYSAAAAASVMLGDDEGAAKYAGEAFRLAEGLPLLDRLEIEAQYRVARKEWDRAISVYEELSSNAPDDVYQGLKLAESLNGGGRPQDALEVLRRLRQLPKPLSDDPRIDLQEAVAAGILGDATDQVRAAAAASAKGREQQAPLLVARALIEYAWGKSRVGEAGEARKTNEEAFEIFSRAQDDRGVARALIQLGELDYRERKIDAAGERFEAAERLTRLVRNKRHLARALNGLGMVAFTQGRLDPAKAHFEEARQINIEIGDKRATAVAVGNLATIAYQQGNIDVSMALDREALGLKQELGDRAGQAFSYTAIAETATDLGQLDVARQAYDEAITLNRALKNQEELAFALTGRGIAVHQQAQFTETRRAHEEALKIRESLDDQIGALENRVQLALAGLDEAYVTGQVAAPGLRMTVDQYLQRAIQLKDVDLEAQARIALTNVFLRENDAAQALQAITAAAKLLSDDTSYRIRFGVRLAMVHVLLAQRNFQRATATLNQILAEADRLKLDLYRGEAELLQGHLLARQGRRSQAETALKSLEARARERGLELIRRKASTLLSSIGPATANSAISSLPASAATARVR